MKIVDWIKAKLGKSEQPRFDVVRLVWSKGTSVYIEAEFRVNLLYDDAGDREKLGNLLDQYLNDHHSLMDRMRRHFVGGLTSAEMQEEMARHRA